MIILDESFMRFSFPECDIFLIEQYANSRVKACECVVSIAESLAFIEAKSSAPRPKSVPEFNRFLSEIKAKFDDSIDLGESSATDTA